MHRPLSSLRTKLRCGVKRPMTQSVFTCKNSVWLSAALMMFFGDVTMANSLKLADPSELAGKWQVREGSSALLQDRQPNGCLIELKLDQTLGGQLDCMVRWLGQAPSGWFPEPDGIALTNHEGSKTAFFSRQKSEFYKLTLPVGFNVSLQRAPE